MRYLLAIVLMFPFFASAELITLSWDRPTTYEDGTVLLAGDIANYRVNWRIDTLVQPTMLVPGSALTAELNSDVAGTHCFTLNTIDIHGEISDPSNEACKLVAAVNNLPVITNPGAQAWKAGLAVNLAIQATDADNDVLSFSATGLPAGLTISNAGIFSV